MNKFFILVILALLIVHSGWAQLSTSSRKARKLYEESGQLLERRQFQEAIAVLEEALEKDQFWEAHYRLANSFQVLLNQQRARFHFEKVLTLSPPEQIMQAVRIHLSRIYFHDGLYSEAKATADSLLASMPENDKRLAEIRQISLQTAYAMEQMKNPVNFNPELLEAPINQMPLQYFPVLTVDQQSLIFTGRIGIEPQYDEDIYISHLQADGWSVPEPISDQINSRNNEGTCTISADGRMLIFTSCLGRRGMGSCDLYVSYKTGDTWSDPQNLGPAVNTPAWESQPALSADGRTLYFVSNRKGGQGKRDLWQSELNDKGEWMPAENLGKPVNSNEDEVSPFIHANGTTLFYSSKGFPGMGGFDLYYSEKQNENWQLPVNLGYPLNTHLDEVSLFVTGDGTKGYYAVDERSNSLLVSSKIFEFTLPPSIRPTRKSNYLTGEITNAANGQPLRATVDLYDINKDQRVYRVYSDSITGNYTMVLSEGSEYGLFVAREGFLYESLNFDYNQKLDLEPIEIDIQLKPVEKGSVSVLKNIFFDFDSFQLKEKSRTELNRVIEFLEINPDVKIEVTGHTDNQGTETYNLKLSRERAKAVYDYLVENDIETDRVTYQGLGDDQPVDSNDTEAGRAANRRIEFRIM